MESPFINFAVTRFVDQKSVLNSLKECAKRLICEMHGVKAIYLFGSFAKGKATPRSDADLLVIVGNEDRTPVDVVRDVANSYFISAPVPVDVFVLSKEKYEEECRTGRGVAGAVKKEGVLLAAKNSPVGV